MVKTGIATLLMVVVLAASSLPQVWADENAVGYPEPFVPKFTVRYVDRSYDVPATTSSTMNPYTGEVTNTTQQGYHAENKTVDIIIENQPIPTSNTTYALYYNIREKGHFGEDWHEIYDYSSFTYQTMSPRDIKPGPTEGVCPALNSKYTVVSLKYNEGNQVDFQVQALYGYSSPSPIQHALFASLYYSYIEGEWSDIQTITITGTAQTPMPNPTNTPTPQRAYHENSNPSVSSPAPTEAPTETENIMQTDVLFFLQNKNILAFGVSCIIIGALMVVLGFLRKQRSGGLA